MNNTSLDDKRRKLVDSVNTNEYSIEGNVDTIKKSIIESLTTADNSGGKLVELKETFKGVKGGYTKYLEKHCKVAIRQCQRYVTIYTESRLKATPKSFLEYNSIEEAASDYSATKTERRRLEADKKAQDNIDKANAEAARRRDSKAGYTNNKNVIDVDQDDVYKPTKEDLKFDEKEGDVDDKWKWDDSYESDFASALGGILGSSAVYKESVKRIADALSEADDELINKVRKFMIQNMHPDKVESDKYKEAYLKLTEVK